MSDEAKALLIEFWHRAQGDGVKTRLDWIIECEPILTRALHAERGKVWEEAAKQFDKTFCATDKRLDNVRDFRVDEIYKWLCAKANGGLDESK